MNEPIIREEQYLWMPAGVWGWMPMPASAIGLEPVYREHYEPIEDEL